MFVFVVYLRETNLKFRRKSDVEIEFLEAIKCQKQNKPLAMCPSFSF
jgi:hypothetical protein